MGIVRANLKMKMRLNKLQRLASVGVTQPIKIYCIAMLKASLNLLYMVVETRILKPVFMINESQSNTSFIGGCGNLKKLFDWLHYFTTVTLTDMGDSLSLHRKKCFTMRLRISKRIKKKTSLNLLHMVVKTRILRPVFMINESQFNTSFIGGCGNLKKLLDWLYYFTTVTLTDKGDSLSLHGKKCFTMRLMVFSFLQKNVHFISKNVISCLKQPQNCIFFFK